MCKCKTQPGEQLELFDTANKISKVNKPTNKSELEVQTREHMEDIMAILFSKGDEYAEDMDAFSNWREAGKLNHCLPETAMWGAVTKHIIALADFIRRLENDGNINHEQWSEKIGDIITYMHLLDSLRKERK